MVSDEAQISLHVRAGWSKSELSLSLSLPITQARIMFQFKTFHGKISADDILKKKKLFI